jgi:hypothetical protein
MALIIPCPLKCIVILEYFNMNTWNPFNI